MVHMTQKRDDLQMEIVLILLRGEVHMRGIATMLGEPHSTVARRLAKLSKENIIDFKKEGKNKVFFIRKNIQAKNYVFNAERYKLIKLLNQYQDLSIIIGDVLKNSHESLVVIFGSYAKCTAKEGSDIDIYVETRSRKVKEQIEGINSKIRVKVGVFDTKALLIKEIIKNHVILKGVEYFYEKTGFFE